MRIGRFQVIEPLAGHGDRRVLAAYDPRLDRKVAIWLGSSVHASETARMQRRLQARAMARLQHPNVVRVHEVGEHDGELFVATDFVRGETLEGWCREHPPGPRERFVALLDLMIQATRGLAAAHAAEVVGLPLRATDLLVDEQGRLRLRGWTLADDEGAPLPAAGEADAREDQRALCRTFWETALGTTAPEADPSDEPVAASGIDVPAWFVAVLRRGLAPACRDRWPTTDTLRAALERGRDGRRRQLGVLMGLIGLTAVVLVLLRPSAREGCSRPADAPSNGWPARREALEQRFAASAIAGAHSPSRYALRRLDETVAQWDAAYLTTCTGSDHADPRAHARLACLERAATSFGVVLEEIDRLEPTRLRAAASLTLALPDLHECRDPGLAIPDEDRDATVHDATLRLAEATTLVSLRRLARAEEIVAALEAEGWAGSTSVETRGRLLLANAAYARGDHEGARAQGFAALLVAEQGTDVGEAAAAWTMVGMAELARLRLDEAAFAAARVESLAAAAGDALLSADAERIVAGVELQRGQPELAVASFEVAERHLRRELGDDHVRLAALLEDMVPAFVMAGQLEQAVATARAAVTMIEALVGPESLRTARARGVLGTALADLGERDEAIATLALARASMAANPNASVGDKFVLGIKHAEQLGFAGHPAAALAVLASLEPPAGDPEAPMVLAMTKGTVLLESGRAAEASELYRALLASLERDRSHVAGMNHAIANANLALALSRSGRTEEALALVMPTIAEYEALGMSSTRLGNVWTDFASVYLAAGNPAAARHAAEQGLQALERGDASPAALANVRAALAAAEAALREEAGP